MISQLSSLAAKVDAPEELVLESPLTGQPIRDTNGRPASIMVLSADSAVGRTLQHKTTNSVLKSRGKVEAENLDASRTELLVALTKSWHLVAPSGEVIDYPCNEQNARALYSDPQFAWIRDQVDAFASNRAVFMKASKPISSDGPNISSASTPATKTEAPTESI